MDRIRSAKLHSIGLSRVEEKPFHALAQCFSDNEQRSRRYAIAAAFIFVDLLARTP